MSLEPQEQFRKFLENSKNILILIPENPSLDAVGSAWALYYFLEKRETSATIAFSNNLSPKFGFLPRPERMLTEISGARDFILSFDTTKNKIVGLRQEKINNTFNVYITPEKGVIDPHDFSFIPAKFKYDLLIIIDSPDLEMLGKIYFDNTDLFFEVPVINIDHRSNNDSFGQTNLVEVTASSCSEILTRLLENIDSNLIDKTIATCLLAGIIGATDSFQNKNTTPRALAMAATLMNKNADQQEIIRWLYKTQSLNTLKLWGRAMAKINWHPDSKFIWSELAVEDFVQSRSTPEDLPLILEKLQENYIEGKIFAVLYNDTPLGTVVLIKAFATDTLKKIYLILGGEIKRDILRVKIEKGNLEEVGKAIENKVKKLGL